MTKTATKEATKTKATKDAKGVKATKDVKDNQGCGCAVLEVDEPVDFIEVDEIIVPVDEVDEVVFFEDDTPRK